MKKKGGIIAAILGVLLLVVGGVLLLTSGPKKSNKELFTDAVEKSLGLFKDGDSKETEAESAIEETIGEIIEKIEKNTYKITVNGEFSEGTGSSNLLGELYVNKDQMYLKVNTDLTGTNLNLEGMYKDDKIYFGLKDILSKLVCLSMDKDSFFKFLILVKIFSNISIISLFLILIILLSPCGFVGILFNIYLKDAVISFIKQL